MPIFQSGYIIEGLANKIEPNERCNHLLHWLSHFNVEYTQEVSKKASTIPAIPAVLNNQLCRGLPTRMSEKLELEFHQRFGLSTIQKKLGGFNFDYSSVNNDLLELCFKALHVIDPKINRTFRYGRWVQSWEELGSEFEESFLYDLLPSQVNKGKGDFLIQLFQPQRGVQSIVGSDDRFFFQNVDFAIEFPYSIAKTKGLIIEIDGSQHEEANQKSLDEQRDRSVEKRDWAPTLRIPTSAFPIPNSHLKRIEKMIQNSYFRNLSENHSSPLWNNKKGTQALQLMLAPFGIARIQKVILETIIKGRLSLQAESWKIGIIERDVPCARIALDDLIEQFKQLFLLEGSGKKLPEIEIEVYGAKEFRSAELYTAARTNEAFDLGEDYDLLIDISILQRPGFSHCPKSKSKQSVTIRSSWHPGSYQKLYSDRLIEYRRVAARNDDNSYDIDPEAEAVLQYFLRNIFRKEKFRKGQLEILSRALKGKSVIGLLPTGGGKSLTYQLAALLQPGFNLVIDPIKSLMKDQFDGLLRNRIDAAGYINSSISDPRERKRAMERMTGGLNIFTFISPERMQIPGFRSSLERMEKEENYFAYCVIDEVHCVSEWGHDFRLSYLKLGENTIKFCKTASGQPIPLFGLTATASFDVLADVQRELAAPSSPEALGNEAIVRFETTDRKELNFEVIRTTVDENQLGTNYSAKEIRVALGVIKREKLQGLLWDIGAKINQYNRITENLETQIPSDFEGDFFDYEGAGLIFCPHRSWQFGVTDRYKAPDRSFGVFDNLPAIPNLKPGTFIGADHEDERVAAQIEEDSIRNQEMFIDGKLNLLVATKAFGMGIDKPDIRFTVHFNYPSSIESFVQEAGRAGRDRKTALGCILFNDQVFVTANGDIEVDQNILEYFHSNSFKGREKETWVIFSLLDEITFPDSNIVKAIADQILVKFEIQTKVSIWTHPENPNNKRLYINLGFQEPVGFLRLPNLEQINQCKSGKVPSAQILNFVQNYIRDHQEDNVEEWFAKVIERAPMDGIERILEKTSESDSFKAVIGFTNDTSFIKEAVCALLAKRLGIDISVEQLPDFGGGKFVEFLNGIETLIPGGSQAFSQGCQAFEQGANLVQGNTLQRLKHYFFSYRGKADTEKAIYRMSCLGIIEDYVVNYNENTFTIKGKKKADQEYIESLHTYVRKYYSDVSTNKRIEELKERKGNSVIRKCLGFLVDFAYTEVVAKRKEAIKAMKDACYVGLEKGNKEFKEYIDLYFNSKYARKGYLVGDQNASLSDRTDEGKEESMDWVWEFISWIGQDKSGAELDNLKHLRGASIRMLRPNPNNFTLLLLKAFSMFVLESRNENLLKEAKENFEKGFLIRKENETVPFPDFLKEMERFKSLCSFFSTDLKIPGVITMEIQKVAIKTHRVWLEKFNKGILETHGN